MNHMRADPTAKHHQSEKPQNESIESVQKVSNLIETRVCCGKEI